MNHVIENIMARDPYDELPDCIRINMTKQQWMWLSDAEKANLVQRETECEYEH